MTDTKAARGDAPTKVVAGVTPDWHRLRVIDKKTRKPIEGVREADAQAGTVTRSEIDENGNLVMEDGGFAVVEEKRDIRIAWTDEPDMLPTSDEPAGEEAKG